MNIEFDMDSTKDLFSDNAGKVFRALSSHYSFNTKRQGSPAVVAGMLGYSFTSTAVSGVLGLPVLVAGAAFTLAALLGAGAVALASCVATAPGIVVGGAAGTIAGTLIPMKLYRREGKDSPKKRNPLAGAKRGALVGGGVTGGVVLVATGLPLIVAGIVGMLALTVAGGVGMAVGSLAGAIVGGVCAGVAGVGSGISRLIRPDRGVSVSEKASPTRGTGFEKPSNLIEPFQGKGTSDRTVSRPSYGLSGKVVRTPRIPVQRGSTIKNSKNSGIGLE